MSGAARWLIKHSIKKTGVRNFDNFFSGYEYTKPAKIIGGSVLGLGVATYEVLTNHQRPMDEYARATVNPDIESLPLSRADQLGYQAPVPRARPNAQPEFTSTGDLVFALHNTRYGGYLG
ncbi:hypothetical protein [Alicyclobacillus shizuokensis]|uniref:hypothetical protein n=1 Tax=Alicyclobacillus shizuokensis TaxID=392014 RepID=UPI0012EE4828|nr:hypothetical protein [Alicyclobacillus shizuokensis]